MSLRSREKLTDEIISRSWVLPGAVENAKDRLSKLTHEKLNNLAAYWRRKDEAHAAKKKRTP